MQETVQKTHDNLQYFLLCFKVDNFLKHCDKKKKNSPFSTMFYQILTHSHTMTPFENTVGKGEISPFPTVFFTCLDNFLPFSSNLKLSSASLEKSKICRLVMG